MVMAVQRARPEEYFKEERTPLIFERVSFSVGSIPVVGVPFLLDGVECVTPYVESSEQLIRGLEAYEVVIVGGRQYRFKMWDDGVTSLIRKADLRGKKAYVMVYEPEKGEVQLQAEAVQPVEAKPKVEEAAPQIVRAQQVDYTPVIIFGLVVLGIAVICFFGYLASKR
ncbi:MAG: hypothetical protein QXJ07_06330 [Candidatus Bathyarchaeia archaeon]